MKLSAGEIDAIIGMMTGFAPATRLDPATVLALATEVKALREALKQRRGKRIIIEGFNDDVLKRAKDLLASNVFTRELALQFPPETHSGTDE